MNGEPRAAWASIHVSEEFREALRVEAGRRGTSIAFLVEEALSPSLGLPPRSNTRCRHDGKAYERKQAAKRQVSVSAKLHDRLQDTAARSGTSMRRIVDKVIAEALDAAGAP